MRSERQALADIAKLCEENGERYGDDQWIDADAVRVILADAQPQAVPAVSTTDRDAVDRAVGGVLFNVSNYPDSAAPHLLGRDFSGLRRKVTDAVWAALTARTANPAGAEPISFYDVKRGDVLLIASLAVSDAPASEEDAVGVLRVRDDKTTRLWRSGHIDLPEATS